ncbi:nitroreductase family protein [Clostridium sp. DJ247]|uniref:nitroreductase family protein n=1 Tax=Clostridium sp. DJ247 TaxID=2726188 RepID=UPI001626EE3D|nr:nitroreductase family protein [Clostridium sp. DJ247]MBC2581676.1 nitroreductase family protein [Clostridium sp. DJ247]
MEFFDLVKSRRSVRKYSSKPVNKEDVLKILDAANWAPSAMNRQPWEFVVVSGKWIQKLGNSYKGVVEEFTRQSNLLDDNPIISSEDFVKFAAVYGGAPIIIVVLVKKDDDSDWQKANLESASAAMENLILAAANLGLGTCWMTGPLKDENTIRHILNISDDKEIVAITPLGYSDLKPKPILRVDPKLEKKIKWFE